MSLSFDPYGHDEKGAEREEADLQRKVQRLTSRIEEFSPEWLEIYLRSNEESFLGQLKARFEAGRYLDTIQDPQKKDKLFRSWVLLEFQEEIPQNEIDQKKIFGVLEKALDDFNEVHATHKEAFELSQAAAEKDGFNILQASILNRSRLMQTFTNILYRSNRNKIKGFSQTSCKVAVTIFIYEPFARCVGAEILSITFEGGVRYKFGSTIKDVVMALRAMNDIRLAYVYKICIFTFFFLFHKY